MSKTFKERIEEKLVSRWVVRGNIVPRALPQTTFDALVKLEKLRLLMNRTFSIRLSPVPRVDWSVPNLKGFCDGILDRDTRWHAWRSSLLQQHACRRTRVAAAASLFLFRKVLPSSMNSTQKQKKIRDYISKMSTPSPPLDPSFESFCRHELRNNFFVGWDKGWEKNVRSFVLPTSSCIEIRRGAGGPRNMDRDALRRAYRSFVNGWDTNLGEDTQPSFVPSGGKDRLVTQFSVYRSFLSPLHRLIYDHISKKEWLLRGDATAETFRSFTSKEGEVFVSGDYESATDNLNINLTRVILQEIAGRSTHVPESVWSAALRSLTSVFPDGSRQASGQLMGSLLSFPFLCLANYLTFRYAIRRPVPVKINGDDIVFRCSTNEKDKWIRTVGESGLVLSVGKTIIHKSVFSLNSCFFISSKSNVDSVPFIRSKCLFGGVEDAGEISGRLSGCSNARGLKLEIIQTFLLSEIMPYVFSSQRSLRRGIGAKVSNRVIRWSRLDLREDFYLSLHDEPPVPLRRKLWMHNSIPDGYVRCAGFQQDSEQFRDDMIETCWTRGPIPKEENTSDDYWSYVREGTYRYVPFSARKFWKLIGGRGEYPVPSLQVRRKEPTTWQKQREGDVAFVSAGFV